MARVFAVTRTEGADGSAPRLHVAVWRSNEDRTLLAAESFGSVDDMRGWLNVRAGEGEPSEIVWTDDLRKDAALAGAVSEGLGVPLPPRPRRRGRRVADRTGGRAER